MVKKRMPLIIIACLLALLAGCGANNTRFYGEVVEILDESVIVRGVPGPSGAISPVIGTGRAAFSTAGLDPLDVAVGDVVRVTMTGDVGNTDPLSINAIYWQIIASAQD
ncbi:MAG: hypothetical protein FWG38_03535 [Defluviitaleaceae bacterium]|nr:hypothetical protein [Defluviitaleaceae bacterium]